MSYIQSLPYNGGKPMVCNQQPMPSMKIMLDLHSKFDRKTIITSSRQVVGKDGRPVYFRYNRERKPGNL